MTAKVVMVQGTASSVGKSLVAAMLCRYYAEQGLSVAPFKSQNMALNSAVTQSGHEIGRAQYVQALAARTEPTVRMNPILLKPEGDRRAQVVVLGKPVGSLSAVEYHAYKPELKRMIQGCIAELCAMHDVVVIEGAGSPAEVNLKDRDVVNMAVAELADAPVILVGDIDRGGVFAAFVGTLELLEAHERARVRALLINKFRGDVALLGSGLEFLSNRTGKPVLGVMPFLQQLKIADEDSLALDAKINRPAPRSGELDVVVVRLPRIANFDDFDPLEHEPGVSVRYSERLEDVLNADLAILPGSKSTVSDLGWLRERGLADALLARARANRPILGICGGCQMLGVEISDPLRIEAEHSTTLGLGLLPLRTDFQPNKRTTQARAHAASRSFVSLEPSTEEVSGYEIHMGRVSRIGTAQPAFRITARSGEPEHDDDGAVNDAGTVVGTLLHGILANEGVRRSLLDDLRARRGLAPLRSEAPRSSEDEFARLGRAVREHLDCELLRSIVGV